MLCVIAEKAARDVGPYLSEAFSEPRTFEIKADFHDVVTVHDRESQKRISEVLFASVPDSLIYAEESGELLASDGTPKQAGEHDIVWYVDPIDGTSNFVSGYDHWCVSIAAARAGELLAAVIYQPTTRTLYRADDTGAYCNGRRLQVLDAPVTEGIVATEFPSARLADSEDAAGRFMQLVAQARSVRRSGSTALALAEVASGHFLATFGLGTHPWDVAAGALLVERAGGKFLGFDEGDLYARDAHTAPNFVATGRANAALLCLQTAGHPRPQAAVNQAWGSGAAGEGDDEGGQGVAQDGEADGHDGQADGHDGGQPDDRAEGGAAESQTHDGEAARADGFAHDGEGESPSPEDAGDGANTDAQDAAQASAEGRTAEHDAGGERDTGQSEDHGAAEGQVGEDHVSESDSDGASDAASNPNHPEHDRNAEHDRGTGRPHPAQHQRPAPQGRPEGSAYWIGRPAPRGPHA
ncbi:MAG: inositol monophosphatase family protein [Actinomycetaceae bacterium]|nr:inositol monophosphatase family protein [Actinomycetaceae bacterium]